MDRLQRQLDALIEALERLVAIMNRDSTKTWRIDNLLRDAVAMRSRDFTRQEASLLAGSITHRYAGMGRFADYRPQIEGDPPIVDGKLAPWVENFDRAQGDVYERALAIRVVEPAAPRPPRRWLLVVIGLGCLLRAAGWIFGREPAAEPWKLDFIKPGAPSEEKAERTKSAIRSDSAPAAAAADTTRGASRSPRA